VTNFPRTDIAAVPRVHGLAHTSTTLCLRSWCYAFNHGLPAWGTTRNTDQSAVNER